MEKDIKGKPDLSRSLTEAFRAGSFFQEPPLVIERFLGRFSSFREGRQLLDEQNQELIGRIKDESLLPFQKDRDIAFGLLTQISERFWNGKITKEVYDTAVVALDALVPRRNEKGLRQIADVILTQSLERLIRSRNHAKEIDAVGKDGPWGKLPEEVKTHIINNLNLNLEMTTNCTVACNFCYYANKGEIEKKMTFTSIIEIFKIFREQYNNSLNHETDSAYWGTDGFDFISDNGNLDYLDVANAYWEIMRYKNRVLSSSTAIPIGEEFRVLKFANEFIRKKSSREIKQANSFRISIRDANQVRAQYIKDILLAIHGSKVDEINFTENRDENALLSGPAWKKRVIRPLKLWDVASPSCLDSVVVGIKSVDWINMTAGSNEKPNGQDRFPIQSFKDGKTIYRVPKFVRRPNFESETAKSVNYDWVYPRVRLTEFVYIQNELESQQDSTIADDPHRAFLRIIGIYAFYLANYGDGKHQNITQLTKERFNNYLQPEIALVKKYLQQDTGNISMTAFMKFFEDNGFID